MQLGLIGGGKDKSGLPSGYTRVEYLESTGMQYINLTGTVDRNTGVEIAYQQTDIGSYQLFEVIGTRVSKGGVGYYWFVPRAANVNGTAVEWFYFRQSFSLKTNAYERQKVQQNYFNSRKTIVSKEDGSEAQYSLSEGAEGVVMPSFVLYKGSSLIAHARIWSVNITQDLAYSFKLLPVLDSTGTPCMFDLVTKKAFRNSGTGQFIAGLSMKQALNLAKLPSTGGSLTISLPKEATLVQHNQQVEAALNTAAEKGWNIPVQYRAAGEEKEIYNKYAECKTVDDVIAVNADYKNDLTEDGEWLYPLTSMTAFRNVSDWWNGVFSGSPIKKMKGVFPACTYCHAIFGGANQLEDYDLEFPIATRVSATSNQASSVKKARLVAPESTFMERCFYYNTQLSELYVYAPKVKSMGLMFASAHVLEEIMGEFGAEATSLDDAFSRCYKLQVFPTYYPKASSAAGMLNECRISKESAIAILDSIPTWTDGASHRITLGIHVDHQNDEEVLAAIENAESKGWTVTVQWNGTPTAQTTSTFGLRKPPIYAKLATSERPDGTTENFLDWGHYVTNWEENGYQEFASIEEAEEHFNIKKEITE